MKNIKAALAILLCVLTVVGMNGCLKYTDNILLVTTSDSSVEEQDETSIQYYYYTVPYTAENQGGDVVTGGEQENTTAAENVTNDSQTVTQVQQNVTQANNSNTVTQAPTQAQEKDPSQWTKAEILAYATTAINKSKAYTGKLVVDHTERYDVNLTKIPGGAALKSIANKIVESATKPTTETLTFTNGKTTTSEGETVPILLPKRQNFALTIDGLSAATAKKTSAGTSITLTIVKESSGLNEIPKHNAASGGYLDVASVDLSMVTVERLDTVYTGSTIVLTVNSDGYVSEATYTIPVELSGSGKAIGITAEFECTAKITEVWKLKW